MMESKEYVKGFGDGYHRAIKLCASVVSEHDFCEKCPLTDCGKNNKGCFELWEDYFEERLSE